MDQEKIKKLLHASSFADCSKEQRREVLEEFLQAIPVDARRHDKSGERDRAFLEKLYWETAETLPALFPYLFPVFSMLCGQRNVKGFAQVDWSVMRNWRDKLGA